jgi:predicted acylesterase/phospholipase RssA
MCKKAFKKRKGVGFPGIEFLVSATNHSRYETKPLESALKAAYGDENLFGGPKDLADHYAIDRTTKVAVTTTTTNGRVILLSSYNRINNDDGSKYQFHRSEKPQREITVWEAARATSAAPRIFKPFDHEQTGQSYLDGAIYYNCPIEVAMRERRLIWPDVADANPDVVLSIGTSYNRKSPKKSSITSNNSRWGIVTHFRQLAKIAIDHVQSTLNSEQTWQDFVQSMSLTDQVKERFIRLNLPLEQDPPRLDEVSAMIELQNMTSSHWVLRRYEIKSIADRLLATAFYFEKSADVAIELEDHSFCITGSIVCRFSPGSEEIRALGEAFRKRSLDAYDRADTDHNPYFVVSQRRKEKEAQQVIIRPHIVDKMIRDAHFSVGKTTLTLSDKMAESDISLCFGDQPTNPTFYPISGFPRRLFEEDRRTFGRSRPSLSLIRKRTPTQFNRGPWTRPSDDAPDRQVDLIKNYEAPNYLYPGGATSDVISEISHRFSSPSPGAPDAVSYGATLSLYDIARSESFTSGHSDNLFTLSRSGSPLPPPGVFEMSADLPERGRLSPRPPLGNKQNARYEML